MKKQTRILLLLGSLCMSFSLFTHRFFITPESIDDFLKGLGVAFIFSAFIKQVYLQRRR